MPSLSFLLSKAPPGRLPNISLDLMSELKKRAFIGSACFWLKYKTCFLGARLNFSVFGFQSVITSLALHETRTHVIIGLQNGSVISKFIRTNKTSLEFGGHSGPVKWLFTTPLNLLSSSTDNTIRYFQLWSGVCLLYVDLSREFSVSSVLLTTSPYSICVVGNLTSRKIEQTWNRFERHLTISNDSRYKRRSFAYDRRRQENLH